MKNLSVNIDLHGKSEYNNNIDYNDNIVYAEILSGDVCVE